MRKKCAFSRGKLYISIGEHLRFGELNWFLKFHKNYFGFDKHFRIWRTQTKLKNHLNFSYIDLTENIKGDDEPKSL